MYEEVNLVDDVGGRPGPEIRFTHHGIDRAERACVGASEVRVNGSIRLTPRNIVQTMPVMRPVLVHREQVPGDERQGIRVSDGIGTSARYERVAVHPPHAADGIIRIAFPSLKRLDEFCNLLEGFALAGEIGSFLAKHLFGEGRWGYAFDSRTHVRRDTPNRPQRLARGRHLGHIA